MLNNTLRLIATSAMLMALPAQAAISQTCIPPAEAGTVMVAVLPDALTSLRMRCGPVLPANSALQRSSDRVQMVYRPAARDAWPRAGKTLLALTGVPLPVDTDPRLLQPLMAAAITASVEQQLDTKDCASINEFYTALEPLPPANVGLLLSALLKLDANSPNSVVEKRARQIPFRVCKAQ